MICPICKKRIKGRMWKKVSRGRNKAIFIHTIKCKEEKE